MRILFLLALSAAAMAQDDLPRHGVIGLQVTSAGESSPVTVERVIEGARERRRASRPATSSVISMASLSPRRSSSLVRSAVTSREEPSTSRSPAALRT